MADWANMHTHPSCLHNPSDQVDHPSLLPIAVSRPESCFALRSPSAVIREALGIAACGAARRGEEIKRAPRVHLPTDIEENLQIQERRRSQEVILNRLNQLSAKTAIVTVGPDKMISHAAHEPMQPMQVKESQGTCIRLIVPYCTAMQACKQALSYFARTV